MNFPQIMLWLELCEVHLDGGSAPLSATSTCCFIEVATVQ